MSSYRLTTDPEFDQVDVMAPYLTEPETCTVEDDGTIRDDDGSAFDRRTYWVVAGSKVMA